jgi:hypothetical protein
MLGLDSDDEGQDNNGASVDSSENDDDEDFGDDGEKQVSFIPGKESLEEKIRSRLQGKEKNELTPWEKYRKKRKQKRREKRQARRNGGKSNLDEDETEDEGDFSDDDGFFVDEERSGKKKGKGSKQKNIKNNSISDVENIDRAPSTKEELQLLVAGEEGEEDARDYNMRGLVRIAKLKGHKVKGARKRKQDKLASNVAGGDFKIDTKDSRFAAVFQGENDRFGIDCTDPNFKETEAMREILAEQTKRRKARKRAKKDPVAPNVNAEAAANNSGGAIALSSLVKSLKAKVAKTPRS